VRVRRGNPLGKNVESGEPAEQQQRPQCGFPNTIRIPSAETDHMVGRFPGIRAAVGRGFTAIKTIKADIPNVTASMPSVR
jgi:hypothetical protein